MSAVSTIVQLRIVRNAEDRDRLIEDLTKRRLALLGKLAQAVTSEINTSSLADRYLTERNLMINLSAMTDQLFQYQTSKNADNAWK